MKNDKPPRVCLHPGCGAIGQWQRGYCSAHTARQGQSELDKVYRTKPYERFRGRLMAFNPICQRIINGEQCHRAGTELHHLIAPTTVQELLDWHRCVMLCTGHHPAGRAGTPLWKAGVDYVATVWRDVVYA